MSAVDLIYCNVITGSDRGNCGRAICWDSYRIVKLYIGLFPARQGLHNTPYLYWLSGLLIFIGNGKAKTVATADGRAWRALVSHYGAILLAFTRRAIKIEVHFYTQIFLPFVIRKSLYCFTAGINKVC